MTVGAAKGTKVAVVPNKTGASSSGTASPMPKFKVQTTPQASGEWCGGVFGGRGERVVRNYGGERLGGCRARLFSGHFLLPWS